MLKRLTEKLMGHAQAKDDIEYYALVASELASGQIDLGMWAKALAHSNGNDSVARSHYIRLRVAQYTRSPPMVIAEARRKKIEQQQKLARREKIAGLQLARENCASALETFSTDECIAELSAKTKKRVAWSWGICAALGLGWWQLLKDEPDAYRAVIVVLLPVVMGGSYLSYFFFQELWDLKKSRKHALRQIEAIDEQLSNLEG